MQHTEKGQLILPPPLKNRPVPPPAPPYSLTKARGGDEVNEMPTRGQRLRPSFSPQGNFQSPQSSIQWPAPPTDDETWTTEEMNLLSMIHRRNRKILHLQEENRRLEMNVLQQGQQLREINAQVEDLKKRHEELKRNEQCCCAPEPIVNVTSAPQRPFFGTKVDEALEEGQE